MCSCRTTNRPEINGIARTDCPSREKRRNDTEIPLFLVLFDCWLIIYNSNKNTGSITSFFMQSSAFRYISQFDTVEQRKKDDYHASIMLRLKTTALPYDVMLTQTQKYMENEAPIQERSGKNNNKKGDPEHRPQTSSKIV